MLAPHQASALDSSTSIERGAQVGHECCVWLQLVFNWCPTTHWTEVPVQRCTRNKQVIYVCCQHGSSEPLGMRLLNLLANMKWKSQNQCNQKMVTCTKQVHTVMHNNWQTDAFNNFSKTIDWLIIDSQLPEKKTLNVDNDTYRKLSTLSIKTNGHRLKETNG